MKKLLVLLVAVICLSMTAQAQFGSDALRRKIQGKVQQKAKEKAEEKAEEKIIESIDKSIDENDENNEGDVKSTPKKKSSRMDEAISRKMMSKMNNVKYNPSYNFSSMVSVYVENTEITDNEEIVSKGFFNTYFDKSTLNYAMEVVSADEENSDDAGLFIFDFLNGSMLILSDEDGEKSGMAMQMAIDSTTREEIQESAETKEFTDEELAQISMYYKATGKTKNIAGHKCREYKYVNQPNDSVDMTVWATRDIKYDYSKAYSYMGLGMLTGYSTGSYLLGTVMEMHLVDLRDNGKSDMYIKEMNDDIDKTFDLSGYTIMGFGGSAE